MEKTISFSVFKEKIIKTDELLSVLLKRNQALEKSQKWIQHLKTKLELSKNEINTLKLRNETLTYNLTSIEKNHNALTDEHDKLQFKFNQLEEESNKTINSLQVKYQHTNQELTECKEELSMLMETDPVEVKQTVKKRKSPIKRKKSPVKKPESHEVDPVITETIDQLKTEKAKLFKEKTDLQLEVYELKKKYSCSKSLEDNFNKEDYINTKKVLNELKTTVEVRDHEIDRLSKDIEKLRTEKNKLQTDNERLTNEVSKLKNTKNKEMKRLKKQGFSDLECKLTATIELKTKEMNLLLKQMEDVERQKNDLNVENEKLKDENSSYKVEISMLQHSPEGVCNKDNNINLPLETNEDNERNESIQMENEETLDPQPYLRKDSITPTYEEIYSILNQMVIPPRISPISEEARYEERRGFVDLGPLSTVDLKNNKNECSNENITLKEIVNKRRECIRRKKEMARRKRNEIDLYGTLLALKKAKIDFIISSNTLLPSTLKSTRSTNFNQVKNKVKPIEKKKPTTVTKELKCSMSCCKSTYMVLKQSVKDEDTLLLGFVGVKNESLMTDHTCMVAPPLRTTRASIEKNTPLTETSKVIENEPVVEKNKTLITNHPENEIVLEEEIVNVNSQSNDVNKRICDNPPTTKSSVNTRKRSCSQPVLRKSKRNARNLLTSMMKKKKTKAEVTNNLVITECSRSLLDESNDKENQTTLCKKVLKSPNQLANASGATDKTENFIFKKPIGRSPKSAFKRPVCSTRRSPRRLSTMCDTMDDEIQQQENILSESSKSPTSLEGSSSGKPKIIPLERPKSPPPALEAAPSDKLKIIPLESPKSPPPALEAAPSDKPKIIPLESPKSPSPDSEDPSSDKPVIIPLEKVNVSGEKMPTSKIEMLFSKLILYSEEEEALNEVVREFSSQEPEYIAEAILERISVDFHDPADTKYHPAPLMTHAQRTMLGFMSKLEKTCIGGVFDSFLSLSEQRLLTCDSLQELGPITRLYLAVCKLKKKLTRMRKMCCDVFYFCGELAVPFLFTVLTSWTEVLPHANDAKDFPLAKVLVQIVYTLECTKPGYNTMPLRDLLIKFYGYPSERWDYDEFFKELLDDYLRNPSRLRDFPLILYCKSRPEKWVYGKIEEHLKPMVSLGIQTNFKATLVILIGNLYNRFTSKSEVNYLPLIRKWFLSLVTDETPEVVKRCVYVSLNRLKKK